MAIKTPPSGYSGTPLVKKLGIKAGNIITVVNAPDHYYGLLIDLPTGVLFVADEAERKHLVHYFTKDADELTAAISSLKAQILPNGMIWISWPKKASKVVTDITEDVIRDLALANGLVDVKVCAVDEVWSGLKLVIPVKNR